MVQLVSTTNLVRLSVGPFTVGLDMGRVLGVERADRIKPSSDRPDLVGRITNRAGEWPVVHLATRLGFDNLPPGRNGQVILTALAGERHGLLIDRVSPITRHTTADVLPVPRSIAQRGLFFEGVLMLEGRPLLLLDPDRLAQTVDLFAAGDDDEPAPPIVRTSGKKGRTDRLLVLGLPPVSGKSVRPLGLAIPIGCVAEIYDAPEGTTIPGAAAQIRELSAWQNGPLPLIDLARWCGLSHPMPPGRRTAVVRTRSGEPLGLLTGPNVQMLPLPVTHIPTRRRIPVQDDRVAGIVDTNDQTLIVPDLTQLIG